MNIPVVIHHEGSCPDYFRYCVERNAKQNHVYILGDDTNVHLHNPSRHIYHTHVNTLYSEELEEFRKYFINYSTNSYTFESRAFEAVFLVYKWLQQNKYEKIVYLDSDCVLLENTSNIMLSLPKTTKCAMSILKKASNHLNMVGCIHNSILNIEFCSAFIQLCKDIYQTKTKDNVIEEKRTWHQTNNILGGICVMTINYILYQEKLVEGLVDLNDLIYYDKEWSVFDHNLSDPYGFLGDNTFLLENNIKKLRRNGNKYYAETKEGIIRLLSLHFQGGKKMLLSPEFM
jgi:hypothetical protein